MAYVAEQDTYRISLPIFEGPFDLLLFFIERDELDVHDIPIASITRDFLDYIRQLERMDIEVASEFILVASTLMRIKAKMLIPRPTLNENGEVEDPRMQLVQRLIEYKKFKAVQEDLRLMEEESGEHFKRSFAKKEEKLFLKSEFPEDELMGVDLYSIMRAFKRIWEKHEDRMARPKHVIRKYPFTVDGCKETILTSLQAKSRIDFVSFILDQPSKLYCVFNFLSILELAQAQKIKLIIGKGYNNFWMTSLDYNKKAS